MCGIAGYIGQSKKPKITFELATKIFNYLETRGTDAAGVWGTEVGDEGRVIYHKEPIRSSDFVKGPFWNSLADVSTDLMLLHARATSKGGGHASQNSNNHPFVSLDKRIGMVHNGTLEEAAFLRRKYEIKSSTDSEFLLRIFEHGLNKPAAELQDVSPFLSQRLTGIKDIWSYISSGAMAVAIGERLEQGSRSLHLFRNDKRPLWLADLRNSLGQIFFFSSPEIWWAAIDNLSIKMNCWSSQKLVELPEQQIWHLGITKENRAVTEETLHKFKVNVSQISNEFDPGNYCALPQPVTELGVLTNLGANETIQGEIRPSWQPKDDENYEHIERHLGQPLKLFPKKKRRQAEGDDWDKAIFRTEHETTCKEIRQTIDSISTLATNLCMEGSMAPFDYQQLLQSLEDVATDLKVTLDALKG